MGLSTEDVVLSSSLKRTSDTSLPEKYSKNTSSKDFKFKLIAKSEIEGAIKHARRTKQKQQDKEDWHSFLGSRLERVIEQSADRRMLDKSKTITRNICAECVVLESESRRVQVNSKKDEQGCIEGGLENELNLLTNHELPANEVNVSHTYQLGGGLTKRLQDLLSTVGRMTSLLLSPGSQPRTQDEEDVDRTIRRSLQFDTMFARNHLYEIQRLIKDTKLVISKSTNTADLESRISAALKSVTQALQVYSRHVSKGSRVKYQQVVPIFQSIGSISSLLERLTGLQLFPLRQEIEVSCSYMKKVLLELSATETGTVSTVSRKTVRLNHRHRPSADLSMYNRRQKEWRKRSASLARARFGLPSVKNSLGKSLAAVKSSQKILKNDQIEKNLTDPIVINNNNFEKSQLQQKESINFTEAQFRNATRAVPEENVMTMMELIPLEPLDDTELCLDENAFQAIKLLNSGVCLPLKEEAFDMPQTDSLKSPDEDGGKKHDPITSIFDQSNSVQLICVTERARRTTVSSTPKVEEADISKDNYITLKVDEVLNVEALGYHQKVVDYHKYNSHYKDDKALGIVDRLANQILTEMLLDFQHEEMDQVVRMLYNLEFE